MENFDLAFWDGIEKLVRESQIVIDRSKGSHHPIFPEITYPVDYGYLKNTTSMDGNGIDVYRGSDSSGMIDAIIVTVNLMKKDSEIKILIGCTPAEKKLILEFHNQGEYMKGLLLER